jgi:hypothetical protein
MTEDHRPENTNEPEDQAIVASVGSEVRLRWHVWANIRSYLSSRNLSAAKFFAQESGGIESTHGSMTLNEIADEQLDRHFSYVVGAIYQTVSFLEALINELFLDAVEYEKTHPQPLSADTPDPVHQLAAATRVRMSQTWPLIERASFIDKFVVALSLADKQLFDKGHAPYQAIPVLRDLRNNLVHFKPETTTGDPQKYRKWEKRLKCQRFALNPWYQETTEPFFPYKCLSYGCAEWAVSKSVQFADEFCNRMEIDPTYQR